MLAYLLGINFGDFEFGYSNIALIAVGITILFQFLMITATYESPRWLFSKKMDYRGSKILNILRGKHYQVTKEIIDIKGNLNTKKTEKLFALRDRAILHPFILVIFVALFIQSSIVPILYYASQIFSDAGYSDEKAKLATLGAVGVVKFVASIVSTFLVDCVGRRVLLILSSIGMIISCFTLGIYFLIFEDKCNNSLSFPECPNGLEYLAISSVVMFIAANSIGWSSVATITLIELLPNRIRALGGSISNSLMWFSASIVALTFYPYTALVTPKFTWWTFALFMALSLVLVTFFIPEAKGRSLEEIQEHFESGKVIVCSCSCAKCASKKSTPYHNLE